MDSYNTKRNYVPSYRNDGWDYRYPHCYFVTICTKGRVPFFGEIRGGVMGLNTCGCIVAEEIQKTEKIRPYIEIDRFVIMPDHIHMIVRIGDPYEWGCEHMYPEKWNGYMKVDASRWGALVEQRIDARQRHASTIGRMLHETSIDIGFCVGLPRMSWGSLSAIINQIKSKCTKRIRMIEPEFMWQRRFHDRIIRNDEDIQDFRDYMYGNTKK